MEKDLLRPLLWSPAEFPHVLIVVLVCTDRGQRKGLGRAWSEAQVPPLTVKDRGVGCSES